MNSFPNICSINFVSKTFSHLALGLHNTSLFVFVSIAVYKSLVIAFCMSARILSFCHRKMVSNSPLYGSSVFQMRSHCSGKEGRKWFLFNDALNTFYLRLYGVGHMVNDHSDSERGNPLPSHGLHFPINSKGSFICTIPQT